MKDEIGSRMKEFYEDRARYKLIKKTPVIMRLDGRAFHTLTKDMEKPFDETFRTAMEQTARMLLSEISGAKCAYIQSDEISILITDFDRKATEAWFDYNIQKMTSIASALASTYFAKWYNGIFDCRVFNIPETEVKSYFIWRQRDWERNALQMVARSYYGPKALNKKKKLELIKMLQDKKVDYDAIADKWRFGSFITKTEENNIKFVGSCIIFEELMKSEDD